MEEKRPVIRWNVLWQKDDWMAVWVGFFILITFMVGTPFKLPAWRWMTESAFQQRIPGYTLQLEALGKDVDKGGETIQPQILVLKTMLNAKERQAIGEAAGNFAKAAKEMQDQTLQKKVQEIGKEIKQDAEATIHKVLSKDNLLAALYLFLGFGLLGGISMALMGSPVGQFTMSFPVIFVLSAFSFFVAGNATIHYYGLEVVFWALVFGLIVSNILGLSEWLKSTVKTEFFIKIGMVLLGAEVLFTTMVKVGAYGMVQAVIVICCVFYVCFWVARKLGLDDEFASILSSAVSICGVSAAIAAGSAVNGDQKKVSYTISLVLLCAVPMLLVMPVIAKALNMPQAVAGAWIGGTIDTTGAVVAAGTLAGDEAMSVAVVVKMAQNLFIGVVAFLLAVWFTFKRQTAGEKPGLMEIWFRFPKFILGFIVASIVFSFFMSEASAKTVTGITSGLRGWWFTLAFFCIGLETKFSELVKIGGGKPAAAFFIAQLFNIFWTLILAYVIFGGVLF